MNWIGYVGTAAFALAGIQAQAGGFTPAELEASYAADLGPSEVDVSSYPAVQKENYGLFRTLCSRCHTLARAVNSPISGRKAWEMYVLDMRVHALFASGKGPDMAAARRVVDFLVFDSNIRKIKDRDRFEESTRKLENRFSETIAERLRRLQKSNPRPLTKEDH